MTGTFVRVHPTESLVDQTSARLREELRATGYVALATIECEVVYGEVILHGVVPTYYLKQLAQTIVLNQPDVTRVQNRLQVSARRLETPLHPTTRQPEGTR